MSKPTGDAVRVASLASELSNAGYDISLIVPKPSGNLTFELHEVKILNVPIENYGADSIKGIFKRVIPLIETAKAAQKRSIIQIECSPLGGYFALAGFSNFILDIHGLYFDEVKYTSLPSFVPSMLYRKYNYFLERLAANLAANIIVVSEEMKKFVVNNFLVKEEKITVIPNGYSESKIKRIATVDEVKGMVTYVGLLASWANVDKIVNAAYALRNEPVSFFVVGDGPERAHLENHVKKLRLDNIRFTGYVSMNEAYTIMAKSQILLSPFPRTLALEVACPIKLLEYMAVGKPMVIDNVGWIPKILKDKKAALVSDSSNEEEFVNNIRILLHDSMLRDELTSNVRKLSKDFDWGTQGKKLAKFYGELNDFS